MHHIKRFIEVKFTKEGVHCYPAAGTDPKLKTGDWDDVSFLANPHFHYFHFEVAIEVFENDRDIEFIQFSRWLQRLYSNDTLQLNSKSCEMLAEELIDRIKAEYPTREIKVGVSEDGINGARLEYRFS
jgi:hypothetical protein